MFSDSSRLVPAVLALAFGFVDPGNAADDGPVPRLENVSSTNLPLAALSANSMDIEFADLDDDGDLDAVVACEFFPNVVMRNDGTGVFTHDAAALSAIGRDSEDIAIADFNGDDLLDIVFVSEDDQVNEYYWGQPSGVFQNVSNMIPVTGRSNAVIVAFLNDDAFPDLLIGNDGQNRALVNNGAGGFVDETNARLPARNDVTQDLELGDVNGDTFLDLIVGNEDDNQLLLNDGTGVFTDAPIGALPAAALPEMTREADFGDIDDDGDLDLFFANVNFNPGGFDARDRLLLNDGTGSFTDISSQIPAEVRHTVDADFVDINEDGHLDVVRVYAFPGAARVLINDGSGNFSDESLTWLPITGIGASGIDVEVLDLTGDGVRDMYLTKFGATDVLLRGQRAICVGDTNCDGIVSVSDIASFVLALTDPAAYAPQFPACNILNADISNDGSVTVSDIGPFVGLLTGG